MVAILSYVRFLQCNFKIRPGKHTGQRAAVRPSPGLSLLFSVPRSLRTLDDGTMFVMTTAAFIPLWSSELRLNELSQVGDEHGRCVAGPEIRRVIRQGL